MRVVVHADASREIGTGHVVRCLALAAALRRDGASVVLASDALVGDLADRAAGLGIEVVARKDAPRRPQWVVVDAYHLDPADRARLAMPNVPRLVIDDRGGDVSDAAIVLNPNLYAGPGGPTRAGDGELLAGPAYALLTPDYADAAAERDQPSTARRLLVTMGGSDPNDGSRIALDACAALEPSPELRIVIGSGYAWPDQLIRRAEEVGAHVVRGARSLLEHIAWADLVVAGCGTTVLEAARLGRPLVGIILADNQVAVARAVEQEGIGVVAGRHPGLDAASLTRVIDSMRHDREGRATAARRGPHLVDGRGAGRASRVIRTGPLRLREATLADADRLLAWRNDPGARAASFDSGLVSREEHVAWLSARLGRPEHRIWIGELGGEPVGVVRFAMDGRVATISVAVASERRGSGIGARLIAGGCGRLAGESAADVVDAWIRLENDASLAAFRSATFRLAETLADRVRLRLSLVAVP